MRGMLRYVTPEQRRPFYRVMEGLGEAFPGRIEPLNQTVVHATVISRGNIDYALEAEEPMTDEQRSQRRRIYSDTFNGLPASAARPTTAECVGIGAMRNVIGVRLSDGVLAGEIAVGTHLVNTATGRDLLPPDERISLGRLNAFPTEIGLERAGIRAATDLFMEHVAPVLPDLRVELMPVSRRILAPVPRRQQ